MYVNCEGGCEVFSEDDIYKDAPISNMFIREININMPKDLYSLLRNDDM